MTPPGTAAPGIGVFGGTFDPIHLGHLSAAREVGEALGLSRILLVPARHSPHKPGDPHAPAHLRLEMVRAAVEGDTLFQVSTVELDREGLSFTADTLEILSEANPGVPLFLILGADQWSAFGRWHRPGDISQMASIVLMARGGELPSGMNPLFEGIPSPSFVEVAVTRLDISSSLVRERVAQGRSPRYLVPPAVGEIIAREKLYLSE